MKQRYLTSYRERAMARRTRDSQWAFMERVAKEGTVWICPWDKYRKHGSDGVYVYGLLGSNEFLHWLDSHKEWWNRGRWSDRRCASPISITDAGRFALGNRAPYDMELINGGMVEPGFVVRPLPARRRRTTSCRILS